VNLSRLNYIAFKFFPILLRFLRSVRERFGFDFFEVTRFMDSARYRNVQLHSILRITDVAAEIKECSGFSEGWEKDLR